MRLIQNTPAAMSASPFATQPPVQGAARPFASFQGSSQLNRNPQFGGGLFNALAEFDFVDVGKSTMRHNQIIYGACIISRMLAASTRSFNEVREHAFRDVSGWLFWFYATPMILRLFLASVAPKDIKPLVLRVNPRPNGNGLLGILKRVNYALNPLAWWSVPTTPQIRERLDQMLATAAEAAGGRESEAFKKVESYLNPLFHRAKTYRNLGSGLSIILAIALLGLGIPALNVMMTRRNVAAGRTGTGGGH
jgi:hypothetical protein